MQSLHYVTVTVVVTTYKYREVRLRLSRPCALTKGYIHQGSGSGEDCIGVRRTEGRHEWGVQGTASAAFSHSERNNKAPRFAVQSREPGNTQREVLTGWATPLCVLNNNKRPIININIPLQDLTTGRERIIIIKLIIKYLGPKEPAKMQPQQ